MPVSQHAERLRRAALHAYEVLDSGPLPELQDIVELAAAVTGSPVAAVNLLDEVAQFQPAAFGMEPTTVPIAESLCRVAVAERRLVAVPDASAVPHFAGSPFVDGRYADVRTYAAAPLVVEDGTVVGTLCVVDPQVRTLTPVQLRGLELLAAQVVAALESRRQRRRLAEAIDELDRLAHVDGLTGLVNRAAAAGVLDRACRAGGSGLLFLDLDDFKRVNDVHGHAAGDLALREVAARVRSALRPQDLAGRWAGDELVVLLADCQDEKALADAGRRVQEAVAAPFEVDGEPVVLSVSVGSVLVHRGSSATEVLRRADEAMYVDKRRRRHRRLHGSWRPRSELDLETQRLRAIDALQQARRTAEQAARVANRTRGQWDALVARRSVLRRQNDALRERAHEHLSRSSAALDRGAPRVVVAHTDPSFTGELAASLHSQGLDVVAFASDGAAAVGVCLVEQPDLFVLQDGLPDGEGVVEEVRGGCPGTLVVAQYDGPGRAAPLRASGVDLVFAADCLPTQVSADLCRLVGVER